MMITISVTVVVVVRGIVVVVFRVVVVAVFIPLGPGPEWKFQLLSFFLLFLNLPWHVLILIYIIISHNIIVYILKSPSSAS